MRDYIYLLASQAQFSPALERSGNEGNRQIRPAGILVPNWSLTRPTAIDVTTAHPLKLDSVPGASDAINLCLARAEDRLFETNGLKCEGLGWLCAGGSNSHRRLE